MPADSRPPAPKPTGRRPPSQRQACNRSGPYRRFFRSGRHNPNNRGSAPGSPATSAPAQPPPLSPHPIERAGDRPSPSRPARMQTHGNGSPPHLPRSVRFRTDPQRETAKAARSPATTGRSARRRTPSRPCPQRTPENVRVAAPRFGKRHPRLRPEPSKRAFGYLDAASFDGVTPIESFAQSPRARSTCSTMSRTAPRPPGNSET